MLSIEEKKARNRANKLAKQPIIYLHTKDGNPIQGTLREYTNRKADRLLKKLKGSQTQ